MSRRREQIDEHILAAYLTGNLPASLRREIASYIAHSDDAMDLLAMANEAMDVSESGDGAAVQTRPSIKRSRVPSWANPASEMSPDAEKSFWKVTALFASAVLVLALIVAVLVISDGSQRADSAFQSWSPHIASETAQIGWPVQPGASEYHVVLYNEVSGERILLEKTQDTVFQMTSSEVPLEASDIYNLWILAIDGNGEVTGRSTAIPIRTFN